MKEGETMGHLSIHCGGCGSDWVVYHRDDWKHWKARTCPCCGKSIEVGTWDRQVLRGFSELEDANIELMKDHTQSERTLFAVSYVPDMGETEEIQRLQGEISDLKDGINNLKGIVSKLLDELFQV